MHIGYFQRMIKNKLKIFQKIKDESIKDAKTQSHPG